MARITPESVLFRVDVRRGMTPGLLAAVAGSLAASLACGWMTLTLALALRPHVRDTQRPFRISCPACHWDLTVNQPELQAVDFGRAKKTGTDEVPR